MKIGVLTSSRADFGIYQPLLHAFSSQEKDVELELIVFGTHLSMLHGYTINEITNQFNFPIKKVFGMPLEDEPEAISKGYGTLVSAFSSFWGENTYDLVFCLGDRFEMSAAVQAGIPFQIQFAHLHGGETTLGAIDNIYRHQISLASHYHFVATKQFKERVHEITHSEKVFNVGALSLDGMERIGLPSWQTVKEEFDIPYDDFVLATIHPETIAFEKNQIFADRTKEMLLAISEVYPIVVTMPNADTQGSLFRDAILNAKKEAEGKIQTIESFGRLNYFTAMQQAKFLFGNTSSGIIEAASFHKRVINLGERQKGRPQSGNVVNCPFDTSQVLNAVQTVIKQGAFKGQNIYQQDKTAEKIIQILIDEEL